MALKDPARTKSDANGGFWAYDAFANAAASHQDSKVAREAPEISHGNASSHPVPGHGGTLMLRGVGLAKVAPRKWRQDAGAVDEIATVFMEAAPHLMFAPVLERFRGGPSIKAMDYVAARRRMRALRAEWAAAVAGFDAVILPTAPILPPDAARLMSDPAYYTAENLLAVRRTPRDAILCVCGLR